MRFLPFTRRWDGDNQSFAVPIADIRCIYVVPTPNKDDFPTMQAVIEMKDGLAHYSVEPFSEVMMRLNK